MSNQEPIDTSRSELLLSLSKLLSLAALMETSLACLETKRVTLEEKMIKSYINVLVIAIADYVGKAQAIISLGTFDIEQSALDNLVALLSDMQPVFEDLQNKIDYDWNFLEQYYEHAFYGRLSNDHRFKERIQALPLCVVATATNPVVATTPTNPL